MKDHRRKRIVITAAVGFLNTILFSLELLYTTRDFPRHPQAGIRPAAEVLEEFLPDLSLVAGAWSPDSRRRALGCVRPQPEARHCESLPHLPDRQSGRTHQ